MKAGFLQKALITVLSLWTVGGLLLTALYMEIYGWLMLRHMWKGGGHWCSEDIYAEPTYCDHAVYYGKVAVIVIVGILVPVYFLRRILKGRN